MPRSAVTIAPDLTSDTTWRTLIGAIKTGIEAMGWTQTSDTGQINFATSVKPPGSSTIQGFALWQATDALAGANPMKIRIAFGSAGSASQLRLTISYGHTTDGAGSFSGVTTSYTPGLVLEGPGSATTTAYNCYFSGDTNRLCVMLFDNFSGSGDNNVLFGMERTHDNTGADTTVGFFAFVGHGGGNNCRSRVTPYTGTVPGELTTWMGPYPANQSSTLIGTQVGLFPIFPFFVIALNPSTQVLTYFTSDISANTIITLPMYGATRTFFTLQRVKGANDQNRCAIRWDT
jgi:hypothetical protein